MKASLGATGYTVEVVVLGTISGAVAGLIASQYWPIFGGIIEKVFAQPWSPARQSLIAIHVIVLGGVGAGLGFFALWARGSLPAPFAARETPADSSLASGRPGEGAASAPSTGQEVAAWLVACVGMALGLAVACVVGPTLVSWLFTPLQDLLSCSASVSGALTQLGKLQLSCALVGAVLAVTTLFFWRRFRGRRAGTKQTGNVSTFPPRRAQLRSGAFGEVLTAIMPATAQPLPEGAACNCFR